MNVKGKIYSLALALAIITTVGIPDTSHAYKDCASATVKTIGVFPALAVGAASQYIGTFTCNDATPAWGGDVQYILSTDLGESGYATLLTASSLKQTVYIRVESPTWRSLVTLMYLNDTPVP
jgi:hypothetical protein